MSEARKDNFGGSRLKSTDVSPTVFLPIDA